MSPLRRTTEPNVIDESMLKRAVEEQGPQGEAGRFAKMEGIDFKDVTKLRLDFKNILKIDNLWQFKNLTKLQLDNNIIEKIEGLSTLVHLVWLDLSFNNIEKIDGLNALVKLEDLSLYNNHVSKVENLDTLKKLQVLSLGNNKMTVLKNLIYLRGFKELRTLNVAGNPLSTDENYKIFIAAYIPQLVYLDFRLIDDNTRVMGNAKYQEHLEELHSTEKVEQRKEEEALKKEKELDRHKAAYVDYLNGPFLFDSMYSEDVEGNKLSQLPDLEEILEIYRAQVTEICQSIFDLGLKELVKREAEVAIFNECHLEAIIENREKGTKLLREFDVKNNELLNELPRIRDLHIINAKILDHNQDIAGLMEALMTLEMQLVDQLEEIIKDYERNITDLVAGFLEGVQGFMAQIRDLENTHHEKLLEIAIHTLERAIKGDLDLEIPDELRLMLVDKDTVINAVGASHDIHLLKIDNREDELITKVKAWASDLINQIQTNELTRNRKRVAEINYYIDHIREDLDNLDLPD